MDKELKEVLEQTEEVVEGAYKAATIYAEKAELELAEEMFNVLSKHSKPMALQTKVRALLALFTALDNELSVIIEDIQDETE